MAIPAWRFGIFSVALAACGTGDNPGNDPDLPGGWDDAMRLDSLSQSECAGTPGDEPENVSATGRPDGLHIDYRRAPFRCSQAVEGFVRRRDAATDVLIQPVEMHPTSVAKCDCVYDIGFTLEIPMEHHTVSVFRRADELNDDTNPVLAGTLVQDVVSNSL